MWSRKRATDRRARDRGVTTVEYGLIIAGVGIAAIAGIFALRNAFTTTFNDTLEGNGVSSCAPSDPNCTAYSALPSPSVPANPGAVAPTVSSVTPSSGPATGGTTVVVAGTGFAANATATLGGATCAVTGTTTPTSLTCVTSAHVAGVVNAVVRNPSDNLSGVRTNAFTYQPAGPVAPSVSDVTPGTGSLGGGDTVTVTGSGFASDATVEFGGIACSVSGTPSTGSATCVTGASTLAGLVDVVVTNPTDGLSGTLADGFRYTNPAPTVATVAPTSGPLAGGTSISITGSGFEANSTVRVGGINCAVTGTPTTNSLTCSTGSASSPGSVDVVVTNPTDGLSGSLSSGFEYRDPTCDADEILEDGACTATPPITICYKIKKSRTADFNVFAGYTYANTPFAASLDTVDLPGTKQTDSLIRFTSPDANSGSTVVDFSFDVTYLTNGSSETGTGTGTLTVRYSDPSNTPVLETC